MSSGGRCSWYELGVRGGVARAWVPARGGAKVVGLHVLNAWSGWGQRASESAAARSPEWRNRGGAWRCGVEEGEGHQRGVCGAREVPGRAGGSPDSARAAGGREPAAEETGGGGAGGRRK